MGEMKASNDELLKISREIVAIDEESPRPGPARADLSEPEPAGFRRRDMTALLTADKPTATPEGRVKTIAATQPASRDRSSTRRSP
jgi:hypothetical protein